MLANTVFKAGSNLEIYVYTQCGKGAALYKILSDERLINDSTTMQSSKDVRVAKEGSIHSVSWNGDKNVK